MNRGEVVRTLSTRARIEPGFTTLGKVLMLSWFVTPVSYNLLRVCYFKKRAHLDII